jgi:hypothetical protein
MSENEYATAVAEFLHERGVTRCPACVVATHGKVTKADQVAAILNVPVGTVRSRLARGRAKLRRLMSADQAVQAQQAFAPGRGPVAVRQRAA